MLASATFWLVILVRLFSCVAAGRQRALPASIIANVCGIPATPSNCVPRCHANSHCCGPCAQVCYIITFGMRFAERTADWAFRPQDSFILSEKVRSPPAMHAVGLYH